MSTIGDRLNCIVSDLTRIVGTLNSSEDYSIAMEAQSAILACNQLHQQLRKYGLDDCEWIESVEDSGQ